MADGEDPYYAPHWVSIGVTKAGNESIAGSGKVKVKPSVDKYCQSAYPGVEYDTWVQKTKVGGKETDIDSVDADGNKVYKSVAQVGCALTCMAMIANACGGEIGGVPVNPENLANRMNDPSTPGFKGHYVKFNAITGMGCDLDKWDGKGLKLKKDEKKQNIVDTKLSKPIGTSAIDGLLASGHRIAAQVFNSTSGNEHWVVITGKKGNSYTIVDPACYSPAKTLLSDYGNIYKYRAYNKT